MGLLARLIWLAIVIFVMAALTLNAVVTLPEAKSSLQVSQVWDEITGIALVLIAITLAWWLAMWRPRKEGE